MKANLRMTEKNNKKFSFRPKPPRLIIKKPTKPKLRFTFARVAGTIATQFF